jgi:pSer/pThr/pTyr-binding forkhead associated (FHA) protein
VTDRGKPGTGNASAAPVTHRLQDPGGGLEGSTITNASFGISGETCAVAQPYVVVLATSDDPQTASSRHLLGRIDEVQLGRGPRSARRVIVDGRNVLELRIPDPRMSGYHGRLMRGPLSWLLDDPTSKNGSMINGELTRRAVLADGALIELGHTFLLFCERPVEQNAVDDLFDGQVATPSPSLATFVGPLADGFAALGRLAKTSVSIVLLGETGTGKEVTARTLHALSERAGAFIAVNCGALPRDLIEAELFGHRRGAFTGAVSERLGLVRAADGGTLFLDEIGELPPTSQAAFLRVLQEREVVPVGEDRPIKVDVRLCAATHRELSALVARGEFRDDLFARLSGFTLELPPLSARRADLGILMRSLLATIAGGRHVRFSPAALRALLVHPWPLNIRALHKTLLTAITLAGDAVIEPAHLAELPRHPRLATDSETPVSTPVPRRAADDEALRERLIALLTLHRGNVVMVSRAIGARRTQIYRWARRFGIDLDGFRR